MSHNNTPLHTPSQHGEIITRRLSDVEPQNVHWLWRNCVPRGKLMLLAGDPGLGKSLIAASVAAAVSGGTNADAATGHGDVLILSAEDDAADTIRPRLQAAGADLTKCHVIDAVRQNVGGREQRRPVSLADDVTRLKKEITHRGNVALVSVDPITAYLGKIDSNNNADVRAVLAPLAQLAAECNVTVIAISHLTKNKDGAAISKVLGSLAFVAAARVVVVVVKDKTNEGRRLLLPMKNNLGNDQAGYAYRIEPVTVENEINTCRVIWEPEQITITADEALAAAVTAKVRRPKRDEATSFLTQLLSLGPVAVTAVKSDGDGAGFSWATLRRAADELGVIREKPEFKGGWQWRLP